MKLTLCDWQLALAAFAYERGSQPTMTDSTYDLKALWAAERGTQLPGFGAETGQWVHQMDQELLGKLLAYALSVNDGKEDLHGPAIRSALDHYQVEYGCCHEGYICWGELIDPT